MAEAVGDAARQGFHFDVVGKNDFVFGNAGYARFQVGRVTDEFVDADALQALDQQTDRAVWRAEQPMNGRQRADFVHLIGSRRAQVGVFRGDQANHAVAVHDIVDQLDAALLADCQGYRRLRIDDQPAQGQDRRFFGQVDSRAVIVHALDQLDLYGWRRGVFIVQQVIPIVHSSLSSLGSQLWQHVNCAVPFYFSD